MYQFEYVFLGAQKNRLNETVHLSTHNKYILKGPF